MPFDLKSLFLLTMADRGLVEVKTPEAVKDVTNTPDPNPICANRLPKLDNVMPDKIVKSDNKSEQWR